MTASQKSECLTRLDAYRVPSTEAAILDHSQGEKPTVVAGKIGKLGFVVTEDTRDGTIEASVSCDNGERATLANVHALCRKMQVTPPTRCTRLRGGGLYWIVRPGAWFDSAQIVEKSNQTG